MYRVEIIANRSVQEETVEYLEAAIPDILYTIIPDVHGRGKEDRKLGTVTWPEVNFILIAYVEDSHARVVRERVRELKENFPNEGIKLFMLKSED
ncbi:MAG TPA: hypothetical protein PKO22_02640 [Treponemataceae bacterium]|nr:hypothetical protein [Treponemataceae bacterium]